MLTHNLEMTCIVNTRPALDTNDGEWQTVSHFDSRV